MTKKHSHITGLALGTAVLLTSSALHGEMPNQFPPSALSTQNGERLDPDMFSEADFCGACHVSQYEDWEGSMHSRAHEDGIYLAFAELARKEGGDELYVFCSACHAPLGVAAGEIPGDATHEKTFLTNEGVTCDACHTASSVNRVHHGAGANASLVLNSSETRFGPLKDAAENDAHPSAFAEDFGSSTFCSACHTLTHPHNGVIIENTYAEWEEGPFAAAGIQCQDCHMRTVEDALTVAKTMKPVKTPGPIVEDGEIRDDVHRHLFVGANVNGADSGGGETHIKAARKRLTTAATIALHIPDAVKPGNKSTIEVSVSNVAAGHAIPTSITELREVWIDLRITDHGGNEIYRSGAIDPSGRVDPDAVMYNSVLADKDGEVTYLPWRAVKIVKEKLIPPGETVRERYEVTVPATAKLPLTATATLRYRSAPQNIMDELFGKGRFSIETVDMASTEGTMGAPAMP